MSDAQDDAQDTITEFMDEIVEQLIDDGEASDLLNDYGNGDSYHRERHIDKDYSLLEAAEILDKYSDDEETDSGLWQGLEPRRAICCQAAYTYGNAVYSRWRDLIKEINEEFESSDIVEDYDARVERKERREELEAQMELSDEEQEELVALKKTEEEEDDNAENLRKTETQELIDGILI